MLEMKEIWKGYLFHHHYDIVAMELMRIVVRKWDYTVTCICMMGQPLLIPKILLRARQSLNIIFG